MKRKLTAAVCWLGSLVVLSCTAKIEGPGAPPSSGLSSDGPGSAPDTPLATADAVALLENPPTEPGAADIACTAQAVPPRGRIWRLSATGYQHSLKDTLGYANVDAKSAPLDSVSDARFSTNSRLNVVSQPWADWYFAEGDKIGAALVASLPSEHACVTSAGANPACIQGFIKDYAGRLFRRPVTESEVTRYQAAYTGWLPELGAQDATHALIQAWTMSPNHVFRTELGDRSLGKVELTQYELASEISFLFADTAPDAALMADAQQGKLSDPAVVRGHAERLLNGPAGREVMKAFFFDFLHLRELAGGALEPSPEIRWTRSALASCIKPRF